MGYEVFVCADLARVEAAVIEWLTSQGMRRADRNEERIDRSVTLTKSERSPSWIAVRDHEHFDLGRDCEAFALSASRSLSCAAVAFLANFDEARVVLFDRGERVDAIEERYETRAQRGRPMLWAQHLEMPELGSALSRAMRSPLTMEDDGAALVEGVGLDVHEVALALGIRDDLFPNELEEPTSSIVEWFGRALKSVEEVLPYQNEPDHAAASRGKIDSMRKAIGLPAPKATPSPGLRIVTIDFRDC